MGTQFLCGGIVTNPPFGRGWALPGFTDLVVSLSFSNMYGTDNYETFLF